MQSAQWWVHQLLIKNSMGAPPLLFVEGQQNLPRRMITSDDIVLLEVNQVISSMQKHIQQLEALC